MNWRKPHVSASKKIETRQAEQLEALIKHAYTNIPYYHDLFRRLNLRPEDIRSQQDLQKLPVLTKQIIKNQPAAFRAPPDPQGHTRLHRRIHWNPPQVRPER